MTLYPNPTNTQLNIKLNESADGIWNGQIWALDGRMVNSFKFNGNEIIDVSSLSDGLYIVRITKDTGESIHGKFLVKH